VSLDSLERAIPAGDRLLLDSTTLIAYFDGGEAVSPLATHIVDQLVRPGRNPAIVSMVTVMEVLVRPLRLGPGESYRHVMDFLTRFPHLRPLSIDLAVAQEAASLRATHRFSSPDALVIATGIVGQVGHLVTNDRDWPSKLRPLAGRVAVCSLSRHL
jgi:PIN domain nuclease of toxin-antitoxin system